MSRRPIFFTGDLALIAGTVFATLAIQRHFSKSFHPAIDIVEGELPAVGSSATNPLRVISTRWREVALGAYDRIGRDRILATAAGVVFYGLLAIFPAITALVSSYGLFADPSTISRNLESLAPMLPDGAFGVVQDEIGRVLAKDSSLNLAFVFGLLFAIWSANAGVKAVLDALNVAYEVREDKRGFIHFNLVSLAFTLAALAAILIMVGAVVGVPLALKRFGLDQDAEMLVQIGRWPVLALILLAALLVLYRYGPSRVASRWRWFVIGAMTADLLWLAGSALLSWYLSNFANYTATYGTLGAAIGLMIWMWMSAIVVLFGAELNSEIECQALRPLERHAGSEHRRHWRQRLVQGHPDGQSIGL